MLAPILIRLAYSIKTESHRIQGSLIMPTIYKKNKSMLKYLAIIKIVKLKNSPLKV